ncbi:MAG: tetratricopeptide repeat protein [Thermosynechococcaceae cyanobacterium]
MTTAKKPAQRLVIFLSLFAFTGSIGYSAMQMIGSIQKTEQASAAVSADLSSKEAQLKSLEASYGLVLKREPDNETALKGLAEVRLQLGAVKEAVPVLEKLVKINPDNKGYQVLLKTTKQNESTAQK